MDPLQAKGVHINAAVTVLDYVSLYRWCSDTPGARSWLGYHRRRSSQRGASAIARN